MCENLYNYIYIEFILVAAIFIRVHLVIFHHVLALEISAGFDADLVARLCQVFVEAGGHVSGDVVDCQVRGVYGEVDVLYDPKLFAF